MIVCTFVFLLDLSMARLDRMRSTFSGLLRSYIVLEKVNDSRDRYVTEGSRKVYCLSKFPDGGEGRISNWDMTHSRHLAIS